MREQGSTTIKTAMSYGLYLGMGLVLTTLIFYLIGNIFSPLNSFISFLYTIVFLSWAILTFRESRGEEGLSFGAALEFGTWLSFFASLIFAFFTYVLYNLVDHNLIKQLINLLKENKLIVNEKYLTPTTYSLSQIFNWTIWGFFFSLILSIFHRRKPSNPFQGLE
jgi:hypothetical protein